MPQAHGKLLDSGSEFAVNTKASVKDIMNAPDLVSILNLPLLEQAYDDPLLMQNMITQVSFDENANDQWIFIWGNGNYFSQKLYFCGF